MVSFGFFNSSNGDRKYSADDISRIFSYLITDGVLMTYGDKFFTTPSTANLGVVLGTGWAWFNNTWTQSDTAIPFALEEPDPSLDRYDTVYLKVDRRSLGRVNSLGVVKGTAAINPQKPTFPTETDVFYHPLAYVKVRHGTTRIAASDIEILSGKTQAPFITSILQTTDITTLFQGWSEQFGTKMTEWENEIDILETSLTSNVNAVITKANQQLQTQQTQFTNQMNMQSTMFTTQLNAQQDMFSNSLNGWETDFQTWFENLQTYLSQDVVTEIWADLQKLETNKADKTVVDNKLDKNNYWDPTNVWSIPFIGTNASNNVIPVVGAVQYPLLSEYTQVYKNPSLLYPYNTLYPTPRAIDRAIETTPSTTLVSICTSSISGYKIPYNGWYTFILIGGGGSGGGYWSSGNFYAGGGGGGSGQVLKFTVYLVDSNTLNITCGSGGNGANGGNTVVNILSGSTSIASFSAIGGGKGSSPSSNSIIKCLGGDGAAGGGGGGVYSVSTPTSVTISMIQCSGGNSNGYGSKGPLQGGGGGGGRIVASTLDLATGNLRTDGGISNITGNGGTGGLTATGGTRLRNSTLPEKGFFSNNTFATTGNIYSAGSGGGGFFGTGGLGQTSDSEPSYGFGGGGGGGNGHGGNGGGGGGKNSSYGARGKGYGAGGGGRSASSYAGGGGGGGGCTLFLESLNVTIPGGEANMTGVQGAVIILSPYIRKVV